ncbi:MAG TPA: GAF domain-containing protein [Actinomycetota bacterium]|nr:GAF domain-containing protein [Actinomycetota bacterium]
MTRTISAAATVDEILHHALEALHGTIRPDRSAVLLFDPEGVMRFRAWRGLSPAYRAAVEGHSPWARDASDPRSFLVEDASVEPSLEPFWPAIRAEGIRSLAFVPLVAGGRLLGKFMLYFDERRALSEEEVVVAETIGAYIAFAIDRLGTVSRLQRSRRLLEVITQGLADGITVQDAPGRVIYANAAAARMAGVGSGEELVRTPTAQLLDGVEILDEEGRPFDPDRFPGRRALAGEAGPEVVIRRVDRGTGAASWFRIQARPVHDEEGRVAFAVNIVTDLTEQKRLERDLRFQKTLLELQSEGTLEGILVVSPDGRILSFNRRFADMWGIPDHVLASGSDEAALAAVREKLSDPQGFYERVRYLHEHPEEESREEIVLVDGRVLDRHSAPIVAEDGTLFGRAWFFRDVTDRKRTEATLRFLAEAGELLSSGLNLERTLERVARLAVRAIADLCVVYLLEGGEVRRLELAHRDPGKRDLLREYARRYRPGKGSPVFEALRVAEVLRTGEPRVVPEVSDEMLAATLDPDRAAMLRAVGLSSAIVAPLRARGNAVGAIVFASSDPGSRLSRDDVPLCMELARRAGTAIDNAHLYREQREARRRAERAAARTERLQAVTALLSGAVRPRELGEAVLMEGIPALSADAGSVFMLVPEEAVFELVAFSGYPEELAERFRRIPADAGGPLRDAMEAGEPVVVRSPDEFARRWPHLVEALAATGDRTTVTTPLIVRGRDVGVLHLGFRRPVAIGDDDLGFVWALSRQLAQALERAALYERELRTATELQENLLPRHLPEIPGLEVAAVYVPFGEGIAVGGDLFDLIPVPGHAWVAMIGDVSGRGPRAAATGSLVRQAVRVAALRERAPSDILGLVNRALMGQVGEGEFCTVCCVRIEASGGGPGFRLTMALAGHPLPVIVRRSGEIVPAGRPGSLLGVFPDAPMEDSVVHLAPGDTMVLFTDGLEERRRGDEPFGGSAFRRVLRSLAGAPADEVVETIRVELTGFSPEPLADDVAIMALRVPEGEERGGG